MVKWKLFHDLRVSEGVSSKSLYSVALEQAKWCDERGVTEIMTSEHHGHEEMCSPLTFTAALGAVTNSARLRVVAALLPLNDPIRLAEEIIVADLVSEGRVEVVIGLGYARHEYEMFGTSAAMRGRDADEKLPVLLTCLEGREFEYRGRRGKILPRPYQDPRPPILIGGAVKASATRAARFGDGFEPNATLDSEALFAFYREECARFGREPGPIIAQATPFFVHVTEDPERDWAIIGPHLLDEVNLYGRWAAEAGSPDIGYAVQHEKVTDMSVVRNSPQFALVTPDECIEIAKSLPEGSGIMMKPLRSAPDIDIGWRSLELFADKVLPHIDVKPPTVTAPVHPYEPRG